MGAAAGPDGTEFSLLALPLPSLPCQCARPVLGTVALTVQPTELRTVLTTGGVSKGLILLRQPFGSLAAIRDVRTLAKEWAT